MKLTLKKDGSMSIKFDVDELDKFCAKCYKPYQESSIDYFRSLFEKIQEELEKIGE